MKPRLALLITASVLPAVLAVPAISSALTTDTPEQAANVLVMPDSASDPAIRLASGGDDDDHRGWFGLFSRDDDDDDDDEGNCGDDEDDEDEGSAACATGIAPAPAGSIAPPDNGLFNTGAAPVVQAN